MRKGSGALIVTDPIFPILRTCLCVFFKFGKPSPQIEERNDKSGQRYPKWKGIPFALGGQERRQRMSIKTSVHSRIKTIKVICDRCKQIVEGIRADGFTTGFYDMTNWQEYRRENEQSVCVSCMFADPKYVERYGSCF